MAAASDRHAAQLVFQSVSVLIADSVRLSPVVTAGMSAPRSAASARS